MINLDSLLLFKLVLTGGFALWMSVILINNLTAFAGGVASVGGLMDMRLLDQEPAIRTPLLRRRVGAASWHRATYAAVVAVEALVAILMARAAIGFAAALAGAMDAGQALAAANLAFAAFVGLGFMLALGGAWFAYYIRQEAMQITHFTLIIVAIAATLAVNVK